MNTEYTTLETSKIMHAAVPELIVENIYERRRGTDVWMEAVRGEQNEEYHKWFDSVRRYSFTDTLKWIRKMRETHNQAKHFINCEYYLLDGYVASGYDMSSKTVSDFIRSLVK